MAVGAAAQAGEWQDPNDVLQNLLQNNPDSAYLHQSEMNIMMMPDNPALWLIDEGEELFYAERGPNNVSLEGCDFGKGPGELEGAYVELPRYFEDTGKVMDFEMRLVHCMKELQGFTSDDPAVARRHGNGSDIMQLTTYIAHQSSGMAWNPPLDHPEEQAMRDAGEVLFFRRGGAMDFNCASCHGDAGKQIRASVLPEMRNGQEWTKAVSWPAHRAGHDNVRSQNHRIRGCVWQMRHAGIKADTPVNTALISFWNDAARGEPAVLPDLKR
ncbi:MULTISPECIES: sulfur oxidation c-type cytochrome SoxA [unclassified Thioalkalivibrio]|uniref:sulfur oxidation c-type cytochrome SoxA n=1 Tax=unclassified Thioalkalivibrio TaxID=2621013 RepID=UPI000360D76C|nr:MULTISPECIES: sulfur oxidation c-type cytochrome SoxA [unclassified Thioalkalivibrio]